MVATRVGSMALMNNTLLDVGQTQVKLAELQMQISGGYKSQTFAGLNGSVEQFTQVTGQIDRATQFGTNNALNISKLQTADAALTQIYNIADQMKTAIVGANGATISTSNVQQVVKDLLASLGNELNSTFSGYYLFGGTNSLQPPVPTTGVSNTVLGTPDDIYYQGSKQDVTMRADERTDIPFPVRADDPAFQKIYAAAKMAIVAGEKADTQMMGKAQQMIQDGISDLSAVRSRVGGAVVNITAIDGRLKALKTYWTELTDTVSKTDIVAASTQVSSYQAMLQASFQVYSRLSQLRLSDYLK